MAISGIGSNYNNNVYESTYAAQKNEGVKKAETKGTAATGVTADIEKGRTGRGRTKEETGGKL